MPETCIFPNFRHSVDDVPNESWTVEEIFQWTLLKSHNETDDKFNKIEKMLRQQLDDGLNQIANLQQQQQQQAAGSKTGGPENQNPNAAFKSQAQRGKGNAQQQQQPAVKKVAPMASSFNILIQVASGNHQGSSFELQISKSQSCLLGRSRGKKFKNNGVSLFKDLEVSTTHGKFAMLDGKPYFVDTGSTNGTKVLLPDGFEMDLGSDEPYELSNGTVLRCGASDLEITLQ